VNLLLSGVRDAFYASALAITVAMVITHLEKSQYRKCVGALDDLNAVIDSLFDSGVEQEYLAAIARQTRGFENQKPPVKKVNGHSGFPMLT
jgi:putative membrane protein